MWLEITLLVLVVFLTLKFIFNGKKAQDASNEVKVRKIPGPDPSDDFEGNLPEIRKLTMAVFLKNLHKKYGPLVSFWEGKKMAISVASPELFKLQRKFFTLPDTIFREFEILTGKNVIVFVNGEDAKQRRKRYDHHFMLKACKFYTGIFQKVAREGVLEWKKLQPNEHIPLVESMGQLSLKAILQTSFGNYFTNEESFRHFQNILKFVLIRLEIRPDPGSEEEKLMKQHIKEIHSTVKQIMDNRKEERKNVDIDDRNLFIDVLLEDDIPEEQRKSDAVGFIIAAYSSVAYWMVWTLYCLCKEPDIQEKLYHELIKQLGKTGHATQETLANLGYLRQILDEAMRLYPGFIYVGRVAEENMEMGGYVIPQNTCVYQHIGTVMHDPDIWPNPQRFDPERFSAENVRKRHPYAFKPFGFAGKRQCPGMSFAYSVALICLSELCRSFRVFLVPGQKVTLQDGVVTRPQADIFIMLEERK